MLIVCQQIGVISRANSY